MSFMRMFKSSKKSHNKENQNVTIDRDCFKLDESQLRNYNSVNSGEPKKSAIVNPYSVVTEPKKHRGPRSCPGAPMENRSSRVLDNHSLMNESYASRPFKDRHSFATNSVRYENLRSSMSRKNNSSQNHYSNMADLNSNEERRRACYESFVESEDDDQQMKIDALEVSLDKMKRRMHEERKFYKYELESAREETEHYKRNLERQGRAYYNAKKSLEIERQLVQRLKKALQEANTRVIELEDLLAEQPANESSILLCSYNESQAPTCGAGEALCNMGEEMVNSSTPSISMFHDDKEEEHDEVRVFRTSEGMLESVQVHSPIEVARDSSSPDVLREYNQSPVLLFSRQTEIPRSHSDTDLSALAPIEENVPKRDTFRSVKNNLYAQARAQYAAGLTSGSSSDEDNYKILEKQVRKKGEVVKYCPPRTQVQPRHYKKFGKSERSALAEFEYLQDMSTDVSGMLSSPDVAQYQ